MLLAGDDLEIKLSILPVNYKWLEKEKTCLISKKNVLWSTIGLLAAKEVSAKLCRNYAQKK